MYNLDQFSAIQDSLAFSNSRNGNVDSNVVDDNDNDNVGNEEELKRALLLSEQQHEEDERMRECHEQEMLEQVLRLSLIEK